MNICAGLQDHRGRCHSLSTSGSGRCRPILCKCLAALFFTGLISGGVGAEPYAEGQICRYDARDKEPESVLQIGAIETVEDLGTIYHISVRDVRIDLPNNRTLSYLNHLPFALEGLEMSELVCGSIEPINPQIYGGIKAWRDQQGGVFDTSVKQAVQFVSDTVNGVNR